jgi:hypothetical protein
MNNQYSDLRGAIIEAKAALPLPELLAQLGLQDHARKSAACPLHKDKSPSFSVWEGKTGWRWKCHAGCGGGDQIDLLVALDGVSRKEAIRSFIAMAKGGSK